MTRLLIVTALLLAGCSTTGHRIDRVGETLVLTEPHCMQIRPDGNQVHPGACTSINVEGFVTLPRGTCVRLEERLWSYKTLAGKPSDYLLYAKGQTGRIAGHWLAQEDSLPKMLDTRRCRPG